MWCKICDVIDVVISMWRELTYSSTWREQCGISYVVQFYFRWGALKTRRKRRTKGGWRAPRDENGGRKIAKEGQRELDTVAVQARASARGGGGPPERSPFPEVPGGIAMARTCGWRSRRGRSRRNRSRSRRRMERKRSEEEEEEHAPKRCESSRVRTKRRMRIIRLRCHGRLVHGMLHQRGLMSLMRIAL